MEHHHDGTTLGTPTYVRLIINLHAYVRYLRILKVELSNATLELIIIISLIALDSDKKKKCITSFYRTSDA